MGLILDVIIFAFLGAVLGFFGPLIAALIYIKNEDRKDRKEGKDPDPSVGAILTPFSLFTFVTVPVGVIIGILFGFFQFLPIFGG